MFSSELFHIIWAEYGFSSISILYSVLLSILFPLFPNTSSSLEILVNSISFSFNFIFPVSDWYVPLLIFPIDIVPFPPFEPLVFVPSVAISPPFASTGPVQVILPL